MMWLCKMGGHKQGWRDMMAIKHIIMYVFHYILGTELVATLTEGLHCWADLPPCSKAHRHWSKKAADGSPANPPFFFYQLWDQTANIICSENELCSCHIVFLIARLHHVQSNLKQNNRQRLLHLCGAPAGRAGRYSTADNGRVPNWRFSRFNSAPCRPAIELWSHSCDFHSCWMF